MPKREKRARIDTGAHETGTGAHETGTFDAQSPESESQKKVRMGIYNQIGAALGGLLPRGHALHPFGSDRSLCWVAGYRLLASTSWGKRCQPPKMEKLAACPDLVAGTIFICRRRRGRACSTFGR